MSNLPLVRHGLDKTGLNPDNFVLGEIQTVATNSIRSVVPKYGPYFAESLKVFDATSQRLLTRGVDYSCLELLPELTEETGKEIYALLIITNKLVSSRVRIDYQTVGGMYVYETKTVVEVMNALSLDERAIAFHNIRNRPSSFSPTKHLHDIGDIYGFEYVCAMLQRIRRAINLKYMPVLDLILKNADNKLALLKQIVDDTASVANSHIANTSNPHNLTAVQVNLGSVVNLELATQTDIDNLVLLPDSVNVESVTPDKYVGLRGLLEFKRKVVTVMDADAQARMTIVLQNEQTDVAAKTAAINSLSQTVTTDKNNQTAVNTTVGNQITTFNNAIESRRSAMAGQFADLNYNYGLLPGRISGLQTVVNNYRSYEQTEMASVNSSINGLNTFLNNINNARIAHENNRSNPHQDTFANTGYSNVLKFTSNTNWVVPAGINSVQMVLVAGGGGGGSTAAASLADGGGGGGAGGVIFRRIAVTPGQTIPIVIGGGGQGAIGGNFGQGTNGSNSVLGTAQTGIYTAIGGGGGGGSSSLAMRNGTNGGSGGGCSSGYGYGSPGAGVSGQGNSGGTQANDGRNGSGGGASEVGGSNGLGHGGNGLTVNLGFTTVSVGGGGGAGAGNSHEIVINSGGGVEKYGNAGGAGGGGQGGDFNHYRVPGFESRGIGKPGAVNTGGGGGGGGGYAGNGGYSGGSGGSGVCYIYVDYVIINTNSAATLTGAQSASGTYSGQSGFSVDRWSDGTTRLTFGVWPHDPPNNQTSDWHWLQFGGVENTNRRNSGQSNYWNGVDVLDLANVPIGSTYGFRSTYEWYRPNYVAAPTIYVTRTAINEIKIVIGPDDFWSTGDTGTSISVESWYRKLVELCGGSITEETTQTYINSGDDGYYVTGTTRTVNKGQLLLTW